MTFQNDLPFNMRQDCDMMPHTKLKLDQLQNTILNQTRGSQDSFVMVGKE